MILFLTKYATKKVVGVSRVELTVSNYAGVTVIALTY